MESRFYQCRYRLVGSSVACVPFSREHGPETFQSLSLLMDMRHEILCIEYFSNCHIVALLRIIMNLGLALLHVVFTHHLHKTSNNFLQFLNEQRKESRPNKVVNYT